MTEQEKNRLFTELVEKLRAMPKGKFEGLSASEVVHLIRQNE